jgi:hypothetical protein
MAHRDYGPGYRDRDDRDVERGRFMDREPERYGYSGRDRFDIPERDYRGMRSSPMYDENVVNREFEASRGGRGSREREYGNGGNWGVGGNRGDFGYRDDRFEGRTSFENRPLDRGDAGVRRGFDRDDFDRDINNRFYRSSSFAGPNEFGMSRGVGLGGGVVNSYDVRDTSRPNYTGRGPKGYRRSDDAIRDEINQLLTRHPDIDASDVEVRVESAEVILTGIVDDRRAKRLAEDIAEDVWGVNDVRNELKIKRGIFAKLTGEKADEREIERAAARDTTSGATTEATRRAGRTNATVGAGGGTSGT